MIEKMCTCANVKKVAKYDQKKFNRQKVNQSATKIKKKYKLRFHHNKKNFKLKKAIE
jgi:hypothetical protein